MRPGRVVRADGHQRRSSANPTVRCAGRGTAPTSSRSRRPAADLAKGLYEYHLDFPGDALNPGCGYEQWARRITAGFPEPSPTRTSSPRPTRPGKLALQYWLFYAFNDWNNLHEGDWEMIQLHFDAATPRQALTSTPNEVGYSQHEGAERASWDDSKLELVDGTHPVVHAAAGSHANFFGEALYLGSLGLAGRRLRRHQGADV